MRKHYLLFLFAFLCSLLLSSCITSKKVNYLQKPSKGFIPSYNDTISYTDYLLRVDDYLYIQVYTLNEDLNLAINGMSGNAQMMISQGTSPTADLYTYLIKPDSCITFPILGKVKVAGKSTREVKTLIEEGLSHHVKYSREEMVTSTADVRVVKRYYSVIGAGSAGRYPINKEKINIFEALAQAGDIGLYGDRQKIRIIRETDNGTEIKMFDVRSEDIINSEYYYVEPNDVIYIQTVSSQFFSVTNLPALISTSISTFSMGILIYNTIKSVKKKNE